MKKQNPWVPMEEAVEGVMRHRGCSRRTARRLIAKHMKSGEIGYKVEPKKLELLDLETTRKLVDQGREDLPIPLSELVRVYRFTNDELLGELRSGRLLAAPINESVAVVMEIDNRICWSDFVVTSGDLADWFANPETPSQLADKLQRKLQ